MKPGPGAHRDRAHDLIPSRRMEPAILGAIAILAVIAIAIISYLRQEERRKAIIAEAATLGLTYAQAPPFTPKDLAFPLFARGDGSGFTHAMSGTWNGINVFVFGFWYYEERMTTDAKGHVSVSRDYSHFTCGLTSLPVPAPATSIATEGVFSGLARVFGVKDLQFESEDFNKRRKVHSDDPKFASYLIDARMMEYLLAADDHCFDLSGTDLLVSKHHAFGPGSATETLPALRGFLDHIPAVVHDVYGGGHTT